MLNYFLVHILAKKHFVGCSSILILSLVQRFYHFSEAADMSLWDILFCPVSRDGLDMYVMVEWKEEKVK